MDDPRDLQARARLAEASGQLAAALDIYQQLLLQPPGANRGALWAHAGDLQLRLGDEHEAAELYAGAVERFVAAECPNVALALCQRVLRTDPTRTTFLLRFAELSASLGYHRDARNAYLEFADGAQETGDTAAAIEALRAYLRSFPGDGAVLARFHELGGEMAETPDPEGSAAEPLGLVSTSVGQDGGVDSAPGAGAEASLVPTSVEEMEPAAHVAPLEGLEATALESAPADPLWGSAPAAPDALPLLGTEIGSVDAVAADDDAEALEDPDPLPLVGSLPPDPEEKETGGPEEEALPVLSPVADPVMELRERVARDPLDRQGHRDLADLLQRQGDRAGLEEALHSAHHALAAAGDYPAAVETVKRLLELRPDDLELHRHWVGYAERAARREELVEALLATARRCEAGLERDSARDLFARVLELDPANQVARNALTTQSPAARPARDYVDLGALILTEEEDDDLTRFQVDIGEPSGDEEGDLAEILSVFREKVAQNLDPKDVASHYDLGVAFKEMGLLDDAIVQFQGALRAGAEPVSTLEMLGECFVSKGELGMAARLLDRATRFAGASDLDLVGVYYWLGRCREGLEELQEACGFYERVVAVDLSFRDAAERLEALRVR